MQAVKITDKNKALFNELTSHPLQTYEWGEFREKTGVKVIRRGFEQKGKLVDGFQLTIHKIPNTPFTIGYLPKGNMPTREVVEELKRIGREEKCIFIQLEPNIIKNQELRITNQEKNEYEQFESLIHDSKYMIRSSAHPLFTKYTFILDLTESEEELQKQMHQKTRYNIRVAEKHGVKITEDDSETAFNKYLELTHKTTTRQKFYAHTEKYHKLMWETLKPSVNANDLPAGKAGMKQYHSYKSTTSSSILRNNKLAAHLLTATYQEKILVTWVVFIFHDTLYYPYGASSSEHREVMASNLIMWETIKFGKKMGLKKFDMWGALDIDPDPKDSWFGFHRFKQGYGPKHVEFVGSFDLIINPFMYDLYKIADKLRWLFLGLRR